MSTTFTPKQVARYFITAIEDMPKISDDQTKPTYNTINQFQRKLDKNLLAIPTIEGELGFLGLTVSSVEYVVISGVPAFVTPTDPGKKTTRPNNVCTNIRHTKTRIPNPSSKEYLQIQPTKT